MGETPLLPRPHLGREQGQPTQPPRKAHDFSCIHLHFSPCVGVCVWGGCRPWLGASCGRPDRGVLQGLLSPSPIHDSRSRLPDVWCPQSRLQLWPWTPKTSLADPTGPGGALSAVGFSPRSGVGRGITCTGVKVCTTSGSILLGWGDPPQPQLSSPLTPNMHVRVTLGQTSLGQVGGSI